MLGGAIARHAVTVLLSAGTITGVGLLDAPPPPDPLVVTVEGPEPITQQKDSGPSVTTTIPRNELLDRIDDLEALIEALTPTTTLTEPAEEAPEPPGSPQEPQEAPYRPRTAPAGPRPPADDHNASCARS